MFLRLLLQLLPHVLLLQVFPDRAASRREEATRHAQEMCMHTVSLLLLLLLLLLLQWGAAAPRAASCWGGGETGGAPNEERGPRYRCKAAAAVASCCSCLPLFCCTCCCCCCCCCSGSLMLVGYLLHCSQRTVPSCTDSSATRTYPHRSLLKCYMQRSTTFSFLSPLEAPEGPLPPRPAPPPG